MQSLPWYKKTLTKIIAIISFLVPLTLLIVNGKKIKEVFWHSESLRDTQRVEIINNNPTKIDAVKVKITDVLISRLESNILKLDFRFENNIEKAVSINEITLSLFDPRETLLQDRGEIKESKQRKIKKSLVKSDSIYVIIPKSENFSNDTVTKILAMEVEPKDVD